MQNRSDFLAYVTTIEILGCAAKKHLHFTNKCGIILLAVDKSPCAGSSAG